MNKGGCVIVIEDDIDDQFLIHEVFTELNYPNEIIFFGDGQEALEFLINGNKNPFLILSDINLPKLSGLELRVKLKTDADIHLTCIAYLFYPPETNQQAVMDAYSTSVQGFFTKPNSYPEMRKQIKVIMDYWTHCSAPNNFLL